MLVKKNKCQLKEYLDKEYPIAKIMFSNMDKIDILHMLTKKYISIKNKLENKLENKEKIIELFNTNVKGKKIKKNKSHYGSEGYWLEEKMGLKPNCKNKPDIFGYEMKKDSRKITFGDYSASEYLFSNKKPIIECVNCWKENEIHISRDNFIRYFGAPNKLKNNRYSWSGTCVPKYGYWNSFGQIMYFNNQLDLCISYSFEKDSREIKNTFPKFLHTNNLLIVIWKCCKLKDHINNKFNKKGFFICKKNNMDTYQNISFGVPFNYQHFVSNIKNSNIIFDSGMYIGNTRNYSSFRSSAGNFWNKLITETF